jgi:hypothetical protein
MKNIYKTYLSQFLVLVTLLSISCTREIEFKGSITEPKMVINGVCCIDSLAAVEVSLSKAKYGNLQEFTRVTDARVFLHTDGHKTDQLLAIDDSTGFYIGTTKIEQGKKYAITVEHDEYGKVNSNESATGKRVNIENAVLMPDSAQRVNTERLPDILCKIKFSDPVDEENFYRLLVSYRFGRTYKRTDENGIERKGITLIDYHAYLENIESTDPVFMQGKTNDNMVFDESTPRYTLFTDELINGKQYELTFNLNKSMLYKIADVDTSAEGFYRVIIELQSISKDLYYYIKSIDGANNITEGLFAEPIQVYSNINNGIGIWGLYSSSIDSVNIGKFPHDGVVESHITLPY